jgi:capsular polysaccharide biosynthesis protein
MRLPSSDWEGPGLLESIWEHKWLVASIVVLGVILAYTWSIRQPVLYRGEVRLFLSGPPVPADGQPADTDPDRNVRNQAEFLTSPEVLRTAIRVSGATLTPEELEKRLTVEPAKDADLITIQAVDGSPKGAAKLTDAVAAAYTRVLRQRASDAADGTIAELERTQEKLKADLAAIDRGLRLQPNDAVLVADRRATIEQIRSVAARKRQVSTNAEAAAGSGASFEKSAIPEDPFQPRPALTALVGGMIGLVAGGSLAWWLADRSLTFRPIRRRGLVPVTQDLAAARGSGRSAPEVVVRGDRASGDGVSTHNAGEGNGSETILDFTQLTTSIQQVFRLLEGPGQRLYEENVPQLVAEDIAGHFPVEWVVVLLENGDGSLKVTGGVGLEPPEGQSAIFLDDDMHKALRAGPRLLGPEEQDRLAKLGVVNGSSSAHLMVPLTHGMIGFGMLLAGQRGGDGDSSLPAARLDLQEIAAQVSSLAPYLRAWLLLRSLRTRLRTFQ